MYIRALTIAAIAAGLALAPAEAKVKTPKSENASAYSPNVKRARKNKLNYKAKKIKKQNFSKKPKKSARVKYGV